MSDIFNDKEMDLIDLASDADISIKAIVAALVPKLENLMENSEDEEEDLRDEIVSVMDSLNEFMVVADEW